MSWNDCAANKGLFEAERAAAKAEKARKAKEAAEAKKAAALAKAAEQKKGD